ncbi:MAG TPA: DUF1674 domain-containing protein [Alphaproteobacteria bacterium]|nr:DUF1674 domain-containing protein [Alphaproteobacteria bacterium]
MSQPPKDDPLDPAVPSYPPIQTPPDTTSPPFVPPEPNGQPDGPPPGSMSAMAVPEIGGPRGPEPTRFGDWEVNGRCSDF